MSFYILNSKRLETRREFREGLSLMDGLKRLRIELRNSQTSTDSEIQLQLYPEEENFYHWLGVIKGPSDTPYENGTFELDIKVQNTYPINPPEITFLTKVFHPNIHYTSGEICLDILKKEWSPAWTLEAACRAIIALLAQPDAESPLNCDAGNMIRNGDQIAFDSLARMYVVEYALK